MSLRGVYEDTFTFSVYVCVSFLSVAINSNKWSGLTEHTFILQSYRLDVQ